MTTSQGQRKASRLSEDQIHDRYIAALTQERGYQERRSDPTNNNRDRMDPFGLIDGRAVMIEFKVTLHANQIRVGHASGSIESKLRAVLNALHWVPDSKEAAWLSGRDPDLEPLVVVAAHRYTDGALDALRTLLE